MNGSPRYGIVKNRKESWTRHPFFLVFAGFVLTGVLGTIFTSYYNGLSTERDQRTARAAAKQEVILANNKAQTDFVGAARVLANEMGIDGSKEILQNAFKSYQEAAVRAYSAIPGMGFLLYHRVPGSEQQSAPDEPATKAVVDALNDLVTNRLNPLLIAVDSCLTREYAKLKNTGGSSQADDCGRADDGRSTYPKIPSSFTGRLNAYGRCVQALGSVMLTLGADPDEMLWSRDPKRVKTLGISINSIIESSCPSLRP